MNLPNDSTSSGNKPPQTQTVTSWFPRSEAPTSICNFCNEASSATADQERSYQEASPWFDEFLPGRKCDGIISLLINLQVVSTSVSSVLKTEGVSLQQPAAAIWNTQWPSTQPFSRNYIKIIMYWVILDPFIAWKSIQNRSFSTAKLKPWPQWYVLYISTTAQE